MQAQCPPRFRFHRLLEYTLQKLFRNAHDLYPTVYKVCCKETNDVRRRCNTTPTVLRSTHPIPTSITKETQTNNASLTMGWSLRQALRSSLSLASAIPLIFPQPYCTIQTPQVEPKYFNLPEFALLAANTRGQRPRGDLNANLQRCREVPVYLLLTGSQLIRESSVHNTGNTTFWKMNHRARRR